MRPKGRSCVGLCIQVAAYAFIAGGLAALTPSHSAAQEGADSPATDRLNVFLECGGRGCDLGFYQDQLAWVNWVSDPANADVQATYAASALPGGGREFQVDFAVTEIEVIASILGIGFARHATLVCFRQFVAIRTLEPCRAPRGR